MDTDLKKLTGRKIAVVMGGYGGEREVSLRSGENVLKELRAAGLKAEGITVDERLIEQIKDKKCDLVCNMVHGKFGEDGGLQGILDYLKIPYSGPTLLSAAVTLDKLRTKDLLRSWHILTADSTPLTGCKSVEEAIANIKKSDIVVPYVLKPISDGSSVGVHIIKSEDDLKRLWKEEKTLSQYPENYFVESAVLGREITVGTYQRSDGEVIVLPILEIKAKSEFYDYKAKYTPGATDLVFPKDLGRGLTDRIDVIVRKIYSSLGFDCVIRTDMIIDASGTPWVLEVNTVPGMTATSDIPAMLAEAGISQISLLAAELVNGLKREKR
jgi:D-alanine-D-alanine ligase